MLRSSFHGTMSVLEELRLPARCPQRLLPRDFVNSGSIDCKNRDIRSFWVSGSGKNGTLNSRLSFCKSGSRISIPILIAFATAMSPVALLLLAFWSPKELTPYLKSVEAIIPMAQCQINLITFE